MSPSKVILDKEIGQQDSPPVIIEKAEAIGAEEEMKEMQEDEFD